jgi:hypothetical protein
MKAQYKGLLIWGKVILVNKETFGKLAREISPYYENNMKVTLRSYETKSFPMY